MQQEREEMNYSICSCREIFLQRPGSILESNIVTNSPEIKSFVYGVFVEQFIRKKHVNLEEYWTNLKEYQQVLLPPQLSLVSPARYLSVLS